MAVEPDVAAPLPHRSHPMLEPQPLEPRMLAPQPPVGVVVEVVAADGEDAVARPRKTARA